MILQVNGDERVFDAGATLHDFLEYCNLPTKMVVVEHNGEIVSRDLYDQTILTDGDNLEIVQMMAGG